MFSPTQRSKSPSVSVFSSLAAVERYGRKVLFNCCRCIIMARLLSPEFFWRSRPSVSVGEKEKRKRQSSLNFFCLRLRSEEIVLGNRVFDFQFGSTWLPKMPTQCLKRLILIDYNYFLLVKEAACYHLVPLTQSTADWPLGFLSARRWTWMEL